MKNFLLTIIVSAFLFSCSSGKAMPLVKESYSSAKVEKSEDGEWELSVFDTDYENFLLTRARPKSMFTEDRLKNRNQILVPEWNSLYFSGKYRNVIESQIDYNPNEKYGFEFEYRLYQVFAYTSWKYGILFNGLSNTDRLR